MCNNAAAVGRVIVQPVVEVTGGGVILAAAPLYITLDANGQISQTVVNTTNLPGLQYLVTELIGNAAPLSYVITPTAGTIDLSSAPRGVSGQVVPNPLYLLAAQAGAASGLATLGSDGILTAAQRPSGVLVSVRDAPFSAKGDGIADDTAAVQAAATAAAGGTLYFPPGTYRTTGTVQLTAAIDVQFAGRGAVLRYTGSAAAIRATTFKGLVVGGAGTIDLSGAGSTAIGIHLAGVWNCSINDMKIIQGPANSTGVLVETGDPSSSFYFGSFCIIINNIDLLEGAGLYGIRTMKTAADTNPIDSVTHFQVNNGWSKGKHTGLYLVNTSTVCINGFCVDTGYNGYYIEKSAGVLLIPGEIGPVDNWAITFGTTAQEAQGVVLLAPSYVGVSGATQRGYLDTSLIQPTVYDMSTVAVRGSAGGDIGSETYYAKLQSLYQYSKSVTLIFRGGGAEVEVVSWSDTGGLIVNGGAGTTFVSSVSLLKNGSQLDLKVFSPDGTKKLDVYHDGTWAQHISDTGHVLQSNTTGTVAIGPSGPGPQLKVQHLGGAFRSINLNHDDTNGTVSTSGGDLALAPSSGLVSVAGNLSVSGRVGFNGAGPIAKPTVTGSRASGAALVSLLAALASLGLITDSTTA